MEIIKRKLFGELQKHLEKKEISLIVGPRQAGKTTLMRLLKEELDKGGSKTIFFSLDSEEDKQWFSSQSMLIKKIELELGKKQGYVFIDEIQRKENAGVFLKGIYDFDLPYKFIVSGSGSLELKEKIHESLVGRKRLFELNPISFEEFVNFKTNYRCQDKLKFSNMSLHFWRTKDRAEVDLVINLGKEIIPVEIKYKVLSRVEIERSLHSFIEKYNPLKAFIVNLNYEHTTVLGKTEVFFLPYWKLFYGIENYTLTGTGTLRAQAPCGHKHPTGTSKITL